VPQTLRYRPHPKKYITKIKGIEEEEVETKEGEYGRKE
jgi:hypothetical protein